MEQATLDKALNVSLQARLKRSRSFHKCPLTLSLARNTLSKGENAQSTLIWSNGIIIKPSSLQRVANGTWKRELSAVLNAMETGAPQENAQT